MNPKILLLKNMPSIHLPKKRRLQKLKKNEQRSTTKRGEIQETRIGPFPSHTLSGTLSRSAGLTWQPDRSCTCRRRSENPARSVHPLLQVVALLQLRIHAGRGHGPVLGEVRRVLPFEVLHAVLRVRLAAEVAIRGRNLVLRLTQLQRLGDGAR